MRRLTRRELLALGRDVGAGLGATSLLPALSLLGGCHHNQDQAAVIPTRVVAPGLNPVGDGSLKVHAISANILSGAAIDIHMLRSDPAYRKLLTEQCSILSPENAMKWDALRPAPDVFEFADADFFIDFAEKNDIKPRGHVLVWHQSLPPWFADSMYKGNARGMLTEHINTVVGRYAGRMHSWDVVNEAVNPYDQRPDGLRNSPWLQLIGEEYIEVAFRAARAADPSALLTYNDYGMELDNFESDNKRMQVLSLLRRLKARNVPIDAVGIQSHLPAEALAGASYTGVAHFISEVRTMGLQVFITEMDVSDSAVTGSKHDRNRAVAATYNDYLRTVLADPSVKAVLTWGISTKHTWIAKQQPRMDGSAPSPLPFDGSYRPLPAFFAMRDAYDGRLTAMASPPGTTANPYAPFTPRQKAVVSKAEQDVKDYEKKRAENQAVQAVKDPSGSSMPPISVPQTPTLPTTKY